MDRIDRELEAKRICWEYIKNNLFYTTHYCKINNEIKISTIFPIYLRNPNEVEFEYFRNMTYEKIFSILSPISNLSEIFSERYLGVNALCSSESFQIYQIKDIYNEYIKSGNKDIINNAIKNNDIKSVSLYLSSFINENVVLLEVKDWNEIDKAICNYSGSNIDDVLDYDYREFFIGKYINLFNIVNFNLTIYKGITLITDEFFIWPFTINKEYNVIFKKVLSNPYSIDKFVKNNMDLLYLFFLIDNFDEKSYMRERKYSVDFISCLEFFVVKKLNDNSGKIQKQFCLKVRKCCKEVGYIISNNELKDLYNYRSLVVHGNFFDLYKKVNKITNKLWYKRHLDKLYSSVGNIARDTFEKEELIYCRLYEIFNIVFKLYCEKNEQLKVLKETTNKDDIDRFSFFEN